MKTCSKCREIKKYSEFFRYKSGKRVGKYFAECKECFNSSRRKWREENPEENKNQYRRSFYKYTYGLNEEDVKKYGECPICLEEKRLVVDHCHTRGHVRGFICYGCNTFLGHLENEEKVKRAREYLNG